MKKYFIKTYGCQMNQADSLLVSSILNNAGFERTENINEAEIILILTCAVREHAEKRALGEIFSLSSLKKKKKMFAGYLGLYGKKFKRKN
jgi:tRNA-2-methylthio-N6-dimethylallyladenosine synthase